MAKRMTPPSPGCASGSEPGNVPAHALSLEGRLRPPLSHAGDPAARNRQCGPDAAPPLQRSPCFRGRGDGGAMGIPSRTPRHHNPETGPAGTRTASRPDRPGGARTSVTIPWNALSRVRGRTRMGKVSPFPGKSRKPKDAADQRHRRASENCPDSADKGNAVDRARYNSPEGMEGRRMPTRHTPDAGERPPVPSAHLRSFPHPGIHLTHRQTFRARNAVPPPIPVSSICSRGVRESEDSDHQRRTGWQGHFATD